MTTDTWEPNQATPDVISSDILDIMIDAGCCEPPNTGIVTEPPVANCRYVMQKDKAFWQQHTANITPEDIIALIRFFTAAEADSSAWFGGEHSPVIHLNKILKQRGHRLDKDILAWIKVHSNNQFLPNGPITL